MARSVFSDGMPCFDIVRYVVFGIAPGDFPYAPKGFAKTCQRQHEVYFIAILKHVIGILRSERRVMPEHFGGTVSTALFRSRIPISFEY